MVFQAEVSDLRNLATGPQLKLKNSRKKGFNSSRIRSKGVVARIYVGILSPDSLCSFGFIPYYSRAIPKRAKYAELLDHIFMQ